MTCASRITNFTFCLPAIPLTATSARLPGLADGRVKADRGVSDEWPFLAQLSHSLGLQVPQAGDCRGSSRRRRSFCRPHVCRGHPTRLHEPISWSIPCLGDAGGSLSFLGISDVYCGSRSARGMNDAIRISTAADWDRRGPAFHG